MYTSRNGRVIAKDRYHAVKAAMRVIDSFGVQPTPARLQMELGDTVTSNLNGRDAKAYSESMIELGYERVPRAPQSWQFRWVLKVA